jgi:hypothetical protein
VVSQPEQSGRKRKITFGAALGGAASVATILTLFLTVGQQSPQPQSHTTNDNGTTTPANIYPVNVQTNFLNSCEANGSRQVCECSLTWFEQHVTIPRFQQDENAVDQGLLPDDFASVETACGG